MFDVDQNGLEEAEPAISLLLSSSVTSSTTDVHSDEFRWANREIANISLQVTRPVVANDLTVVLSAPVVDGSRRSPDDSLSSDVMHRDVGSSAEGPDKLSSVVVSWSPIHDREGDRSLVVDVDNNSLGRGRDGSEGEASSSCEVSGREREDFDGGVGSNEREISRVESDRSSRSQLSQLSAKLERVSAPVVEVDDRSVVDNLISATSVEADVRKRFGSSIGDGSSVDTSTNQVDIASSNHRVRISSVEVVARDTG